MLRILIAVTIALAAALAPAAEAQPAVPNPVIRLVSIELYSTPAGEFLRHRFEVTNRSAFPAAFFTPAPQLPPCGTNTNAARAWVDFFGNDGKRLYGFCALNGTESLKEIWFAVPKGTRPPTTVQIEIHDRQTGSKYRSNLASTSFY